MKYFRYLALLLGVVCLAVSCSKDLDENGRYGEIDGSVNDYTTGEPVSVVNVTLSPGGKSTVTGSDGTFIFDGLAPGTYAIKISKEGYTETKDVFEVVSGKNTQAHMLIQRIPAEITADKSLLDFGEDLSTLSFKLVNRGYQDLNYSVEAGDCKWITVDPAKDILAYGKTATVVVTIDRSQLVIGENNAMIVVRSSNGAGNTEIKVSAIRNDNTASVNTLPADEITHSSARLNGEITAVGKPAYSERGFLWHTQNEMTLTNCTGKLSVAVTSNAKFNCTVSNLKSATTYYARAYVVQDGTVIYGNVISFGVSTRPATITTSAATGVTANTATLNASVADAGAPEYTERGFCYLMGTDEPTVANNRRKVAGTGIGSYSLDLTGLSYPKTYTARAYLVQNGETLYGNSITFNTSAQKAALNASAATNVTATSATLNANITVVGQPAYTERGFCYVKGSYSQPTIQDNRIRVSGSGVAGTFSVNLTNLEYDYAYRVRAYAIQDGEPVYSNEITFSTQYVKASVLTSAPTNISATSARFNATISNVGDPLYTQRGFCYSCDYDMPTVKNSKVVEYSTYGLAFKMDVSGLKEGETYYVRSFLVQDGTEVYGNVVKFQTLLDPQVVTGAATNYKAQKNSLGVVTSYSCTLNGFCLEEGIPAITYKGFVVGSSMDPVVNGYGTQNIIADYEGYGSFERSLTGIAPNTKLYYRAWVKNATGYFYGESKTIDTYK